VNTPKLCISPSFIRQRTSKVAKIQCRPNIVKNDLYIEPGAAISIQKAMGMESKKKAARQQIPESPIVDISLDGLKLADLKIQTADVAEALNNVMKRLAQKDNLAAIVEAAGLDNVAENLRQGVGEADEVAIVYVRDADGQMKQIKNEKKPSADHGTNLPENAQGSSSEKEDKNDDKEGVQVIEIK
jgi:hypothetical protein